MIVADLFVQSLLSMPPDQRKNMINETVKGTITDRVPPATLKEFSIEYFRYLRKLLTIFVELKKSLNWIRNINMQETRFSFLQYDIFNILIFWQPLHQINQLFWDNNHVHILFFSPSDLSLKMWTGRWFLKTRHLKGYGQTPGSPSDSPCLRDCLGTQSSAIRPARPSLISFTYHRHAHSGSEMKKKN